MTLKQFIFKHFPIYIQSGREGAPFVYWSGTKMPLSNIQKNIVYQYAKDYFQPNVSVQSVSRILEHGD